MSDVPVGQWRQPGISSVGQYQISGTPWVTGSSNLDGGAEDEISLPYVSSYVEVRLGPLSVSNGGVVNVAFAASGSGDVITGRHMIQLDANQPAWSADVKCTKLYISNATGVDDLDYSVFAALTGIPGGQMWHLTGSGITDSA